MLRRQPGFTVVVVVTLALGIGANTAIFTVVSGVVLKPLPFEDPERLVVIEQSLPSVHGGREQWEMSPPELEDLRACGDVFAELGGVEFAHYTLTGVGDPERLEGASVTGGFFRTLGVRPSLGRLLDAADDRPGQSNVVVLTHRFWKRHFAGQPEAVGGSLTLDKVDHTIVGVLPAGFRFPLKVTEADVFTPLSSQLGDLTRRSMRYLTTVGRLKPGVKLEQAQARVDALAARLAQAYPDISGGCAIHLTSLHEKVVGDTRPLLFVLLGAVGLVLLIACANAANLLLARGADRRQELALRAALGAGRGRLLRQLLTEGVALAVAGGVLGLVLAVWGTDVLASLLPDDIPRGEEIVIDRRVLGFALGLSILTGLLFGLPSAVSGVRVDLHSSLKAGGRRIGLVRSRQRFQGCLVVSEVALALVLLAGAGLLLRSFKRLTDVDAGFIHENVLTFRVLINRPHSERVQLRNETLVRLSGIPGVESVGTNDGRMLAESGWSTTFEILGSSSGDSAAQPSCRFCGVNPEYFATLGIPLLKGRMFTDRDLLARLDSPGVGIINEAMARRFPPGQDPIGGRIRQVIRFGNADPTFEIVGIVGDVHDMGLDADARPYLYVPYVRHPGPYVTFALRTSGDPLGLIGAVRHELATLLPDQAPYGFATLDQLLDDSLASRRCPMRLLGLFSTLALILAAVGIYGVLSYSVTQRRHEIGVRMAIGAQRGHVLGLVIRRGLALIGPGLCIGVLLALASTRVLSSMLYEISATDTATLVGVCLLLATVALLACYIPARRATKVDPMVALRCE
jgi:putative ABC transport system permease protein